MDGACPRCGLEHVAGCGGHVEACTECELREGCFLAEPCPRCGGDVVLTPCRNRPLTGLSVCGAHGGKTPRSQAARRRRLAEAEALASLADVEVVPVGDPLDALAQLAAEALAFKDHLAAHVAELGKDYRFTSEDAMRRETEQLDARVGLYERAMDRCQRFLSDWVRLGFEDRKVRVDEVRAGLLAVALAGVLRELGHDPESAGVLAVLDRWLPVLDGLPAPKPVIDTTVAS
jgi:hypothetical protein